MLLRKIIIGILSFYFYDPKKYFQKEINLESSEQIVLTLEKKKKREEERRKSRSYKNKKWKKKKEYREKTFAIKGKEAKDKRFSNQQLLRRMYRNS